MQKSSRGKAGVLSVLATALCASASYASPPRIEKSLMGVHVLETADRVEKTYHAPQHIYALESAVVPSFALDANGNATGGVIDVIEGGAVSAGGLQGGGGAGLGRMGAGGGRGLGLGSMSGQGGARNQSDANGDINTRREQYEEERAALEGANAAAGAGAGGQASAAIAGTMEYALTKGGEEGYTWVYLDPHKQLEWEVTFSRDNHVLNVIERGKAGGGRTNLGVGLGDSVAAIYTKYGWPERMTYQGIPGADHLLVLNYSSKYHVQFATLNNKVVGIAVFLFETRQINFAGPNSQNGGVGNRGGFGGGGRPGLGLGVSGGAGKPGLGLSIGGGR